MNRAEKQAILRQLMGGRTRQEFADLIGRPKSTLDTWLAPASASWSVEIDDLVLAGIKKKLRKK